MASPNLQRLPSSWLERDLNFRGHSTTLHTVARCLRDLGGFDDATRRAIINQNTKVVSFLKQFPEFFTVNNTLGRGGVAVVLNVLFLYFLLSSSLRGT